MIIDIRGAGFLNKGAEMMLICVINRLRKRYGDTIQLSMWPNNYSSTYIERARMGLYQTFSFTKYGFEFDFLGNLLPEKFIKSFGIINERSITAVIDISGYFFSDKLNINAMKRYTRRILRWKKKNKKIIFLPQSIGPFQSEISKRIIRQVITNSDIFYVRDNTSMNYLAELDLKEEVLLSPDFTLELNDGKTNQGESSSIAVVPNMRVIDKEPGKNNDHYITALKIIVNYLQKLKYTPFFLIHEGMDDFSIARKINTLLDNPVEIIKPANINNSIKIIKSCKAVIGSRYHALLCALYNQIPILVIGWSHKYTDLLNEYEFENMMLGVEDTKETIYSKIDDLIKLSSIKDTLSHIYNINQNRRVQIENMWDMVYAKLES